MKEEIIYFLSTDDIQTVAKDVLDRELSAEELLHIKELVPKYIDWFSAIENAIYEEEISSSK